MSQCSYTQALDESAAAPTVELHAFHRLDSLASRSNLAAGSSLSPLLAIAPGPTQIVRSSRGLGWEGLLLERHLSSPGERLSTSIDRHVVSMLCCNSSQFEYRAQDGRLESFSERPGSVTFTPAGPVPYVRLQSSAHLVHCAFQQTFTQGVVAEMERQPTTTPVFRAGIRDMSIQRLLGLLTEELEARTPSGRLYVDSLAHALATRYLLLDDAGHATELKTSPLPRRILDRVKEKIEANLDTDLSLDNLARESGYSRSHFLRMFRVATGLTPHQYILSLRLEHAQHRIKQTTHSLIDIAALCGFSSQSHMTTVFRRHLDMTPAEFRRSF